MIRLRGESPVSLSFLDVLASAVGAVTLLLLILSAMATFRVRAATEPLSEEVRLRVWVPVAPAPGAAASALRAAGVVGGALRAGDVRRGDGGLDAVWSMTPSTREVTVYLEEPRTGLAAAARAAADAAFDLLVTDAADPLAIALRDFRLTPDEPGLTRLRGAAAAALRAPGTEDPLRRMRVTRLLAVVTRAGRGPTAGRLIRYEIVARFSGGRTAGPFAGEAALDPAGGGLRFRRLPAGGWEAVAVAAPH